MSQLFDLPFLAGLRTKEELITPAEEQALIAAIDQSGLEPFRFGAFAGRRLTRSFGLHYDFSHHRLARTDPLPAWLLPARDKAAAFAGFDPPGLVHALLIRYDPGAGIGWHKDRPVFDRVIGVSLGAATTLAFRRRRPGGGFDRFRLPLPPRSAYLLSGEARHGWEHGIAAYAERRHAITFRTLSVKAATRSTKVGKPSQAP